MQTLFANLSEAHPIFCKDTKSAGRDKLVGKIVLTTKEKPPLSSYNRTKKTTRHPSMPGRTE